MIDLEEDMQDTHITAENKAEAKDSYKLTREEREDFVHSLEHIVTVGSSIRRAAKRRAEWEARERAQLQENVSVVDNGDEEDRNERPANLPPMMHAEDVRIYGKRGARQNNWPTSKARLSRNDKEWDIEHGDCIHLLAFVEARLSDVHVPPSKRQRVDGFNLSLDKTDCSVAFDEVPRAMLARCWERALHAASTTINCNVGASEERAQHSSASRSISAVPVQDNTAKSVDDAMKKCRDLNIRVHSTDGRLLCPTCSAVFDSSEVLRKHFFGCTDHSQRGCCWTKIRTTQYELLNQVLQQDVKNFADGLMEVIMLSVDHDPNRTGGNDESRRPHSWQEVLRMLESVCDSPRGQLDSNGSMQETLQYKPQKGFITLNMDILRNAKLRLIDRYADLPL